MTTNQRKEKDPQEILEQYQKDLARWRERGQSYKDINPLTIQDVMYIKHVLHPTAKQDSKDLTKNIVEFICERGICTAQDIYDHFGYSDKPVLKRLKIFKEFGFVRRESKKWYLPTPRMYELQKRFLRRICS